MILNTPRPHVFACGFFAAALVTLSGCPKPLPARLAIAWNVNDDAEGRVQLFGVRAPWTSESPVHEVGADAVLAAWGDYLYVLSRRDGSLVEIDTRNHGLRGVTNFGEVNAPESIVIVNASTAYLTHPNTGILLRINLQTGAVAETADLSVFADDDGNPDLGEMLLHEGRLFVQVRRFNETAPGRMMLPAMLAVVDAVTGGLLDVDPSTPEPQAIELEGTGAKHAMQVVPGTRRLAVGATGGFFDDGGIELIDLDTLQSLGLAIREDDGFTGADLGSFLLTGADSGYLVYSTDWDLSSHLRPFSFTGGVDSGPEMNVSVGYFVPSLAVHPASRSLFAPDNDFGESGVFIFDTDTNQRRAAAPIPTAGRPTDLLVLNL